MQSYGPCKRAPFIHGLPFCLENVFNYLSFWWENAFPRGWDVGGEGDSLLLGTLGSVVVIGLHRTSGKWTGRLIPFYGKITRMNLPFESPLEARRVFTECCSCIYKASLDSHLPESLLPTPLPPTALLSFRATWQQRETSRVLWTDTLTITQHLSGPFTFSPSRGSQWTLRGGH